jgi:hypothetical protein
LKVELYPKAKQNEDISQNDNLIIFSKPLKTTIIEDPNTPSK